jgi:SAM-dependent methyltransferase
MAGYVGDVAYTLGFYRELSPTYLSLACVLNGVDGPNPTKDLRYCELGCGRGYGTTLLAAANPNVDFVGIDFNPSHIAEARTLSSRAGISNVAFLEMGFGDAARSPDPKLKDFDIVGIHGVYSWVKPEIRADVLHFLRDKVLAGGLVYNSYNTLPGWTTLGPVHHLIMQTAKRSSRDSVGVLSETLGTLDALVRNNSALITQNPGLKGRLELMQKQEKTYLAHEFVNEGWQPLYVTEVMAEFAEAKFTYIGSANLLENGLDLSVPANLRAIVRTAPDDPMRELLKDYIVNKQFRRDLYIKGPQRIALREKRQRFNNMPFAKTLMTKTVPKKFQLPIGEAAPKKESLAAILSAFESGVCTGGELLSSAQKAGLSDAETALLTMMLISAGSIAPARADHDKVDRSPSDRINQAVMELTLTADTHRFLASPVIGSALGTTFIDRILAPDVVRLGNATDCEIAGAAFNRLASVGRSFRREEGDNSLPTDANIEEIAKLVREFRDVRFPRWSELGIVSS